MNSRKFHQGQLYLFQHSAWSSFYKIGCTNNIQNRKNCLSTSLIGNINIISTSSTLLDKFFYEFLLKIIFNESHINKEFFNINVDEFNLVISFFEFLNA